MVLACVMLACGVRGVLGGAWGAGAWVLLCLAFANPIDSESIRNNIKISTYVYSPGSLAAVLRAPPVPLNMASPSQGNSPELSTARVKNGAWAVVTTSNMTYRALQ